MKTETKARRFPSKVDNVDCVDVSGTRANDATCTHVEPRVKSVRLFRREETQINQRVGNPKNISCILCLSRLLIILYCPHFIFLSNTNKHCVSSFIYSFFIRVRENKILVKYEIFLISLIYLRDT